MAVLLFAAVARDVRALAVVIGIGFLISNGFLEDRFGQLAWHRTDVWLLVVLIAAGVIGSIHRRQSALTEKEKHDA